MAQRSTSDHKAAFQLINSADTSIAKIYEYPIWLKELGEAGDEPTSEEAMSFRLNISSVLAQKQAAISKHGLPNLYNQINSIAPSNWWMYGITP